MSTDHLPRNAAELQFLVTATASAPTMLQRTAWLAGLHKRGQTLPDTQDATARAAWQRYLMPMVTEQPKMPQPSAPKMPQRTVANPYLSGLTVARTPPKPPWYQ